MTTFTPVDFNPFANDVVPNIIKTTEEQREIWTSIQIGGDASSLSYNESVTLVLKGNCNVEKLKEACHLVVQRYDALRGVFTKDGEQLEFKEHVDFEIPVIDSTDLSEAEKQKRIKHFATREVEIPFDLINGPLFRFAIIKNKKEEHLLFITVHHIVCDGWSLGIMMQDLSVFYSALVNNIKPELEQAQSFSQYANRQQERKQNGDYEKIERYWLKEYAEDVPVINLPINNSRPAMRTFNAARFDLEVSEKLVTEIKKLGAKNGCSFVNTLFAAFEVYLYRITGQADMVLGLPTAGQSAAALYNMVGHCVNLLPIRSKINPALPFSDYIKERRKQMFDAFDHQEFTMGSLLGKLPLQRDPSRIPLVPVVFNVDLGITSGVNFHELTYEFISNPRKYENFELFVNASGMGDTLILECTYNTDLFNDAMIEQRMEEFAVLLEEIVSNPSLSIAKLNLLTKAEQQRLFVDWMGKDEVFPIDKCIHQLFEETAKQYPGNTALIFKEQKLSYQQLNEKANQLAAYLQTKGVGPGVMVAIYMERCPEIIISILAILKAGGAYVPIDLSYPKDRISYLLEDAACPVLLSQKKYSANVQAGNAEVIYIENFDTVLNDFKNTVPASKATAKDLCYVIYTSGSTGKPKGVLIENITVVNYISYCNTHYFGNKEYGNFGLYSSLSFDLTVTSIFCSLTRGKTLTIFPQELDIPEILKETFSANTTIDVIKMTPAHILVLENFSLKTAKIKKGIVGGEELTPKHVEILRAINPQMEIINEYGPTEATVGCIIKDVQNPNDALTIGRPISNTQIYILDSNLQPVPPGIPGKLFIGGNGLARGYHNRKELTAEKFIDEKFTGANFRLYDSGDLARFRLDGDIDFLGRIDNQVKIRGYRIEIGEIENALAQQKDIKEFAVIIREDIPGDKRLVAYLSPISGKQIDIEDTKERLRAELPEYMIPSAFIVLDALPLTTNGKIDRKALPKPEVNSKIESANFEEPHTPAESMLAGIWSDILQLDKIGIHDNFFELGGHSLLGIKMMMEIERRMGAKLNYPTLFRASTISQLAKVINKENLHVDWPIVAPLQKGDSKTPLFFMHMHNGNIQRWRVLLKYLGSSQTVFAIQPQGLDESKDYHYAIEEMATFYINEIKKVQPHGPYRFAGLCFGGTAAFEVAKQLKAANEEVELLFTVNNYAPPENPMQYKIRETWDEFSGLDFGDKLEFAIEKTKSVGRKMMSIVQKVVGSGNIATATETTAKTKPDIRWVHSVALLNYQPQSLYNGNITLVRTGEEVAKHYDEFLGWQRLVNGKINLHVIPGSDNDSVITDEKYYEQLGKLLSNELSKLNS